MRTIGHRYALATQIAGGRSIRPYPAEDQVAPTGPGPAAGPNRVIRGGGWNGTKIDRVHPTFRHQSSPDTRSHGIGLRCAKEL